MGTVVLMLYTNVILALITIATVPIMIKLLSKISSKSRAYFKEQQESIGKLNGYVEETITGQKVVKVFCHEDVARSEFKELNVELREKQIKAQFFGGMIMPIMAQISTITYAVVACVGGLLCLTSGFDIGGIAVFCNYSRQFGRPINELSNQINIIFSALAGAERVFNTMDKEPEVEDSKDAVELKDVKGRVVLENVTFGYNKDMTILKNISLYAHPGQKIAFVGSTGAGKTTITNLLTRFYDICEGNITIDDIPLMSIKKDSLRSSIAMVLQDTHLFTGTVMENIRYGRLDATDEEVIEAAKTASAHSFIRKLPDGYNTMLVGDGSNLSQGQRQLISIARASISKAPILILDEATSSVDTRTEKHIEHGMDRLMKDRTTFVIAHRLSTVRNSNAIMVLENGEIIERGEHDELVAQKGRYYELYTGLSELD
ncbi:putative ABC transporter ATP-binding protein [Clostridium vincentii]|uniref:Putative ABC transporter ATP-binding protein n=1 Tax=Clostridium vincentii TaxID=52704 RepID=A0A2T0BDW2_9CLOT|nr:putative ABC transporter ATP-binding protein [Clostridium vincentii]